MTAPTHLIQTREPGGPWHTLGGVDARDFAIWLSHQYAAETIDVGEGNRCPRYTELRVVTGGEMVYDPRTMPRGARRIA